MKRNTNRWEEYCETTYNSLKANVHNWGRPEFFRPLTRTYYMGVFDCGNPNHTNLISQSAYDCKRRGAKTVFDHYLSPQFVGRMILDNPDVYLTDYSVFRETFYKSCGTIIVTAEENIQLSHLTNNDGEDYKVYVPTDQKYQHLGINLLSRPVRVTSWKKVMLDKASESDLHFPDQLLEYEKNYLVA